MNYNNLRLFAYSGTNLVTNSELERAEDVIFSTIYPGGLYGKCTFTVPREVEHVWAIRPYQRLVVMNGLVVVWEGKITAVGMRLNAATQRASVEAVGYWSDLMTMRKLRKPWCDTRQEEWRESTTAYSGNDKTSLGMMELNRNNRLRWTPKALAFTINWYQRVTYTAPTGETIKRITFNYDLQESTQQWALELWNTTAGAKVWDVTASGTGSVDRTLATPAAAVLFMLRSCAAQTPPADGTVYGQITDVVVYTETGPINLTEIAKDVIGYVTELSADVSLIGSNTLAIEPFYADPLSYADILAKAAGYGDASFNSWGYGIRSSDLSSDGKPILFVEQYPVLTSTDYVVRLGEDNLLEPFDVVEDIAEVRNWIAVRYRDAGGRVVVVTPASDAALKDITSITAYGQREEWLTIQTTSATTAKNYAKRVLAARKDPQWKVSGDIRLKGYVRGATNQVVPASEVRAGQRIRIENFLRDVSGSGMTLLIAETEYVDRDGGVVRLSTTRPDRLSTWLARFKKSG